MIRAWRFEAGLEAQLQLGKLEQTGGHDGIARGQVQRSWLLLSWVVSPTGVMYDRHCEGFTRSSAARELARS